MSADGNRQVRTYRIPTIEIYEVTDEQLELIEKSCSGIGQDLTFAVSSLSILVSFLIALSSGNPTETARISYMIIAAVAGVVCLYTGSRWLRARRTTPPIIKKIRSRRMNPEPTVRQT